MRLERARQRKWLTRALFLLAPAGALGIFLDMARAGGGGPGPTPPALRLERTFPTFDPLVQPDRADLVVFSEDGRLLFALDFTQNVVRGWQVPSGRVVLDLHIGARLKDFPEVFALTPDKRYVITGGISYRRDRDGLGEVVLCEVLTGGVARKWTAHGRRIFSVACDPRGKRFATVGADGFVRLWALPSCKEIARIQLRSAGYVAFMPPGKMCLIGTERQLELWDPETGKLKPLLKYRQQPGGLGPALAVSPDGKKFAAGTFSRTESGVRVGKGQPLAPHDGPWLRVWDVGTGKKLLDLEQDDILWMAFHADGRHLLTLTATGEVVCWDLPGRRRVATWRLPGRATEAALSPAGDRLATAHMAGTVRVWRIPWEKLPKGNGEGNGVSSIYPPIK